MDAIEILAGLALLGAVCMLAALMVVGAVRNGAQEDRWRERERRDRAQREGM